ncbi:MAG: DUF285 domain-containing protein [Erysipelotrichaceae bacterium]|nr:DUF285 domain-containing protein [Erysipelotrichaceae bacterium]
MYDIYIVGEGGVDANSNSSYLFYGFENCTSINFNDCFCTSNTTDMSHMFSYCLWLSDIDLSSFDTSNVNYMNGMFSYCRALTEIDLSNFDMSNVEDDEDMFYGCPAGDNY